VAKQWRPKFVQFGDWQCSSYGY
jgi:hypothetical protein